MNSTSTRPSAAESAQTALQMLAALETDVSGLVTDKETGVACMVKKYRLAAKDSSLTALERFFGTNEKPVCFALPDITDAASCAKAQAAVLRAVASGEIPPSEGQTMSTLIENQRRAFETTEMAERLEKIEGLLGKKGITQ